MLSATRLQSLLHWTKPKSIVPRTQRATTRFAQATTVMKVAATISVTKSTKATTALFLTRTATLRS